MTPLRKLFLHALPPPSNSKAKKIWPTQDSPNNPFLTGEDEASTSKASGWESSEDEASTSKASSWESSEDKASTSKASSWESSDDEREAPERQLQHHSQNYPPADHFISRGQKATFHNLQYHHVPEVLEASKLPIDHPDFEVAEACASHRLFANKLKCKPCDCGRSQDVPPNGSLGKSLLINAALVPQKGSAKDEVTEAISPGGHIIKRRARSQPISLELLESLNHTPSPKAEGSCKKPLPVPIAFPSVSCNRNQPTSFPQSFLPTPPLVQVPSLNLTPIPSTASHPTAQLLSSSGPPFLNLHSPHAYGLIPPSPLPLIYSAGFSPIPIPWTMRLGLDTPSPQSLPLNDGPGMVYSDDEDMLFDGPTRMSLVFSITEGMPSPRSQKGKEGLLPSKYRPHDSGMVLSDDELIPARNSMLSTSSSSLHSDNDNVDDLVTPGIVPGAFCGWPRISGVDDAHLHSLNQSHPYQYSHCDEDDVDVFILHTLEACGKPSAAESKKPSGMPMKKIKSHFGLDGGRPW
ncbi:hypothetical protein DFH29DRAFT_997178 [Suillus ampliporus]|nr:hypothetical protein DFH29DRAFT_997178 [Suillus ampliporus]